MDNVGVLQLVITKYPSLINKPSTETEGKMVLDEIHKHQYTISIKKMFKSGLRNLCQC